VVEDDVDVRGEGGPDAEAGGAIGIRRLPMPSLLREGAFMWVSSGARGGKSVRMVARTWLGFG
jgi:hypothetical protein